MLLNQIISDLKIIFVLMVVEKNGTPMYLHKTTNGKNSQEFVQQIFCLIEKLTQIQNHKQSSISYYVI